MSRDAPSSLIDRVYRKLRGVVLRPQLKEYLAGMDADHPFRGIPTRIVGDASVDPTEFFSHYDAYGFWVASKLASSGTRRHVLDVGSPKIIPAMLSAGHDVSSLVLADCSDRFSSVRYVRHDISDPLPFSDGSFDCLTSTVALNLCGLARYGDRLNANCLPQFVRELNRVMSDNADLLISLPVGPNLLAFNNSWFLDLDTVKMLFGDWELVESIRDACSAPRPTGPCDAERRFAPATAFDGLSLGDYRVVFFHFRRGPRDIEAPGPRR